MIKVQVPSTKPLSDDTKDYFGRLDRKVADIDRGAGEQMVALARSRVPKDTGGLLNGITARSEGTATIVEASAVNNKGSFDYARVTEFGRRPGQRGHAGPAVADETFFASGEHAGAAVRRRKPSRGRRGDGGEAPHPFFYNSAREVAEARGKAMEAAPEAAARESRWSKRR